MNYVTPMRATLRECLEQLPGFSPLQLDTVAEYLAQELDARGLNLVSNHRERDIDAWSENPPGN